MVYRIAGNSCRKFNPPTSLSRSFNSMNISLSILATDENDARFECPLSRGNIDRQTEWSFAGAQDLHEIHSQQLATTAATSNMIGTPTMLSIFFYVSRDTESPRWLAWMVHARIQCACNAIWTPKSVR